MGTPQSVPKKLHHPLFRSQILTSGLAVSLDHGYCILYTLDKTFSPTIYPLILLAGAPHLPAEDGAAAEDDLTGRDAETRAPHDHQVP